MAGYQDPVNQSGGSDDEATSDNAILASRLAHWISVTSHYTCVWPYMEINVINVARHKLQVKSRRQKKDEEKQIR